MKVAPAADRKAVGISRVCGSRVPQIMRWFQIRPGAAHHTPFCRVDLPLPLPGQIMLITGPSGSGKSTLLRVLRRRIPRGQLIDVNRVCLPDRPVIDLFAGLSLDQALLLLSRLGLAEAHTYLLRPRNLSVGQRWRLRLALAICSAGEAIRTGEHRQTGGLHAARSGSRNRFLLADEFASNLDTVSAMVVSHALRRCLREHRQAAAILASNRDELRAALDPEILIACDFGRVSVQRAGP